MSIPLTFGSSGQNRFLARVLFFFWHQTADEASRKQLADTLQQYDFSLRFSRLHIEQD